MSSSSWRKDIQGLRAIAIISVVLFHSGLSLLPGGFIGVDIFFVISGYLITQILLKENEVGTYSLLRFYQRRIRRLFPALLVLLAFCLIAGAQCLTPQDYRELALTAASTTVFISNFALLGVTDYFYGIPELKPLLHTWSLAVEEQFYIVFPILLALIWRFARQWLGVILGVLLIASFAFCVWMTAHNPRLAFYLPLTRAHELLIGAIVAASPGLFRNASPAMRGAMSVAGLALIAVSFLCINLDRFAFPGWVVAAPCFGTALVIASGRHQETFGGKLISSGPFQFFGALSYSLYLWHWPILVFARHSVLRPLTLLESAGAIAIATVIAYLSWRFLERPFIKGFSQLRVITVGAAGMATIAAVSALIYFGDGLPQRFKPSALQFAEARNDFSPLRERCHISGETVRAYNDTCVLGAHSAAIAVWGDSHGAELSVALLALPQFQNIGLRQITASGCPPALHYAYFDRPLCSAQNDRSLEGLTADASIRTVIMTANVYGYSRTSRSALMRGLEQAIGSLRSAGKDVLLVSQIPLQPYDPPSALSLLAKRNEDLSLWGLSRVQADRAYEHIISEEREIAIRTGAELIEPDSVYCNAVNCPAYWKDIGVMYFNAYHLSVSGARPLAQAVAARIRKRHPHSQDVAAR